MYIVDLGLRNHILPRKNYDLGFLLKTLFILNFCVRGYKVTIGKVGNLQRWILLQRSRVYINIFRLQQT